MGDFFSDCIVNDADSNRLLYPLNIVTRPKIGINVPINENNNIELGYSIISPNPDALNDVLTDPNTNFQNVQTVYFTKQINCSLVANSLQPEISPITKWTCNDESNDFKKTVYPGVNPLKTIGNNKDFFRQQTLAVEGSIHCWCLNNLYPSGYASSNMGIDMKKYAVYVGNNENGPTNARCFTNCTQMLKDLKTRVNKQNLKAIPQYEAVNCSNLQWTSFNKFSDASVMEAVENLINPPVKALDTSDPYFDSDTIYNRNYFNSIVNPANCECGTQIKVFIYEDGVSTGYTGCTHDENAATFFPYLNVIANNYVNLQNIVYVDAFSENQDILKDQPVLLKLVFNTEFYYIYDELPEPIINNETVSTLRWNPSCRVYFPEQADYFLITEDDNVINN